MTPHLEQADEDDMASSNVSAEKTAGPLVVSRWTAGIFGAIISGLIIIMVSNSVSAWAAGVDRRLDRLEEMQAATITNQTNITMMQRQMDRIENKIDQHISSERKSGT